MPPHAGTSAPATRRSVVSGPATCRIRTPLTQKELAQALIDLASIETTRMTAQLMQLAADAGEELHAIVGALNVMSEARLVLPPHLVNALRSYGWTLSEDERRLLETPLIRARHGS